MTAASASVDQRTVRSPDRWAYGSNWNAMTAIGTVR